MHVSEIDTPALVVDLDIMERNLARVAGYAREAESGDAPLYGHRIAVTDTAGLDANADFIASRLR